MLCNSESGSSTPRRSALVGKGLPSTTFVGSDAVSGGCGASLAGSTTFLVAGTAGGFSAVAAAAAAEAETVEEVAAAAVEEVEAAACRFAVGSRSLAEARRFSPGWWSSAAAVAAAMAMVVVVVVVRGGDGLAD
jgi:hypothetical protein